MSEELTDSRYARARARTSRRRKIAAVVAVVLTVSVVAGVLVWAMSRSGASANTAAITASPVGKRAVVPAGASAMGASGAATRVEVPDLGGMTVAQATTVLQAAGLAMRISREGTATSAASVLIGAQQPMPGTVAGVGTTVVVTVPAVAGKQTSKKKAIARVAGSCVVVIDPGHQSRSDQLQEPIGPGSTELKPRMTAGATGATSGVPEYEIDLEIATNLGNRLKAAGVHVVMTRTTNDVDISNAERAQIANRAKADLFVRIHADSSTDARSAGISTLYPASNAWTQPITVASSHAAALVQQHMLSATAAQDGGSAARSDIAGFNWSKVPVVSVQAGFPSNPVEDRLLSSAHYQDLLAQGMTDGILQFLKGGR